MRLERISWEQAQEYFQRKNIAVVPLGATESHGSHLALGTDFLVPQNLVERMDERLDVLFTPVMPYGVSDQHVGFPGTITIGYDGLYLVMKRVVDTLYQEGIRKIVFLNGHGGNDPVLQRVGMELARCGGLSAILNWWQISAVLEPAWKGGHGGGQETAAIMAIDPALVQKDRMRTYENQDISPELPRSGIRQVRFQGVDVVVPRPMTEVTTTGWFGPDHPTCATPEWGEAMLSKTADYMVDFIRAFEKVQLSSKEPSVDEK